MKHKRLLKKISVFAMISCMLLGMLPVSFQANPADAGPKAGIVDAASIPEDAIYISTTYDLIELAENCIDEEYSKGKVFVLNQDIHLTGVDFDGIPTFGGTFLGQGHKLYGIEFNQNENVLGFFRFLQKDAVVNGLILQMNVQPDGANTIVGGIAGVNKGTIRNCVVNGVVSGKSIVGGFVGENRVSGTIENCMMNGLVHGASKIGGFVGKNQGVIRECINNAEVNTAVEHNTIGMDISNMDMDLEFGLDMDMDSFGFSESMDSASDIGGIVGSSNGYLTECVNYAEINGANGVGGIAGQMKPSLVVTFDEYELDTSLGNMDDLKVELKEEDMQSIKDALNELEKLEDAELPELPEDLEDIEVPDVPELPEDFEDVELPELPEDFEDVELPELPEDFEDLESEEFDEDKFHVALNDLSNSLNDSIEDIDLSLPELDTDVPVGVEIVDVSRDDTEADTLAKANDCVNYGNIYGSKYVGGIAGNANTESSVNMDEDIEINGELSISGKGEQRLVIRDCTNYGKVSVTKKYAGGIAGGCDTVVMNSISKSIIAGSDYVGGITGWGCECYNSCAFVDIVAGTKYIGSIFGSTEVLPGDRAESSEEEDNGPLVTGNTYYIVGKNIGGIDGINYAGASSRITLEQFLALPNLADAFKTVSIRFIVEGKEDVILTVPTGGTLALDQLPVPEVEDGDIYEWVFEKPVTSKVLGMNEVEEVLYLSEARLTDVLFNQTYEADFNPKHMVAQGKDKTNDGKVRILAIGAFDTNTDITLTNVIADEKVVLGEVVSENWNVNISNIGVEELRYRVPTDMNVEKIKLYVKDASGNWSERDYTIIGSYLAFDFVDGDQGFALQEVSSSMTGVVMIAIAAIVIIAAGLFIRRKKSVKVEKNEK